MAEEDDARIPAGQMMLSEQEQEVERGLRFAHMMMQVGQIQGNEVLTSISALTGLLVDKGIISDEEITQAHERARKVVQNIPRPMVRLSEMGNKYEEAETVEIDCASLIHLCHARCCTLPFVLTNQDVDEGVARWDYGNPYFNKRGADGYCVHCDPETRACAIHAQRPHVCRKYDCRQDKRIWIDFEKKIPTPVQAPPPVFPVAMAERLVIHKTDDEADDAGEATSQAAGLTDVHPGGPLS
jgi:Fe-S-cluster containining protein